MKVLSLRLMVLFKIKCKRYGELGIQDKLYKGIKLKLTFFGVVSGYQMERKGTLWCDVKDVLKSFFNQILRIEMF